MASAKPDSTVALPLDVPPTKVNTSALVVMPPMECWAPIQAIRVKHDARTYKRWPPHINLLYPFIPGDFFPSVVTGMQERLASMTPFQLRLTSFGHFEHRQSATIFLDCTNDDANARSLRHLQAVLVSLFPFCNDLNDVGAGVYTPHLTVGRADGAGSKSKTQKLKETFATNFAPIEFTVDKVYLMSRVGEEPFKVKEIIHLGQSPVPSHVDRSTHFD